MLNKAMIIGNLGKDPEVRYMPNGNAVCNLTIATLEKWTDKTSGEKKEATEWHRVVLFDKQAEVAGQYLKKGRPVYIEGKIKTRKWTDKDGVEKYTTEIHASSMTLLPSGERPSGEKQEAKPAQESKPAEKSGGAGGFADMDDDIPFITASADMDMQSRHARRMERYK